MSPPYDGVMDDDQPMEDVRSPNGFGNAGSALTSTTNSQSGDDDYDDVANDENGHREEQKRRALLPTGCCYDDRMKLHTNADFGQSPHHPEDPTRIESIMRTFKRNGLVYTGSDADLAYIISNCPTKYMWRIPAREATREEILKVHITRHYDWAEELSKASTAQLRAITKRMDTGRTSLYVGSMSFDAALIAAGGAIETCKSVVAGNVKNAFAIIRPPGHHAERDQSMGFCVFNNVPIAAKTCQDMYPDECRKIMILDWDVHHGNGIQNMFYDDPNILYISLHVYQNGKFYPGDPEDNENTPGAGLDQCGSGPGAGKNVNIGWHDQGMGDGEYLAAFQKIVMPIGLEFNPDLVIISAGFDAADGDELGGCFVTPACYAHMTHMLMSLAGGKVAVCLEGGYNLDAISASALAVARTLMGEPPPKLEMPRLNRDAAKVLAQVQAVQSQYWECMRPGVVNTNDFNSETSSRLHDVVRNSQRQVLSMKYGMIPLYIQREALFKSYENQVLVTRDIHKMRRILFIIHDPPELVAQPDALTNNVEPHNAWVSDGVTNYIDWAVNHGFAVMDVNVPSYITKPDNIEPHTEPTSEAELNQQMETLVCYLWDNYLQLYDHEPEIFLMGVGNAYLGIKMLLMNRADVKKRVSGVINFVNGALRAVKSEVDHELASWYKEHSLVYVARNHACWENQNYMRKVAKRRFGQVVRSGQDRLVTMMREAEADVAQWILERCEESGDTTDDDKVVV